nr:aldo/keto reductase [Millisia brevis]
MRGATALHAFEKATGTLGVEQLDLLILHQPAVGVFDRTIAAYKSVEKLYADGLVRAIGVSNFTPVSLRQLLDVVDVIPAVNQIELHPYFVQKDSQQMNAEHSIPTRAWSPIGGITFYGGQFGGSGRATVTDPVLVEIAAAHGRTTAQVMLRWHIQQGRQVIPKSINPARIAENFDVFDFELTGEELGRIDALDTDLRGGPDLDRPQPQFLEFRIPEA